MRSGFIGWRLLSWSGTEAWQKEQEAHPRTGVWYRRSMTACCRALNGVLCLSSVPSEAGALAL